MTDVWVESKVLDQAQRRRNWRARDEFGRVFESTMDIISQAPCAPINAKGWADRLQMPQKYLLKGLVKDEETGQLGIRIKPALEEWASDLEKDHAAYDKKLYDDALMLFGQEGPRAYEDRSPALLNYTGTAPQAIEPILAALAGDEWALGLSENDVNDIQRFFPKKETAREKFLASLKTRDDVDDAVDLDEQHDREALGGKRVPVGKGKRTKEEAAA